MNEVISKQRIWIVWEMKKRRESYLTERLTSLNIAKLSSSSFLGALLISFWGIPFRSELWEFLREYSLQNPWTSNNCRIIFCGGSFLWNFKTRKYIHVILYYVTLYCIIILNFIILYYTVLYYIILYYIILYYIISYYIESHYIIFSNVSVSSSLWNYLSGSFFL